MENQSFEQSPVADEKTDKAVQYDAVEATLDHKLSDPVEVAKKENISEEERQRRIEGYKKMIESLEEAPIISPSTSRSPLHSSAAHVEGSSTEATVNSNHNNNNNNNDTVKGVVLLNTFMVAKKRSRAFLHDGHLIWERQRSIIDPDFPEVAKGSVDNDNNSSSRVVVAVENILAVHVPVKKNGTGSTSQQPDEPVPVTLFQLHYARRRTRNPNMWKNVTVSFYNKDARIVSTWITTLHDIINDQRHRPRHILLFVNPYGGKRQAMSIYNRIAKPLFLLAAIDISLIVTQRPNQVTDIVMTNYLEQYDGIVCVGGDGTFNELYNGLVRREMADTRSTMPEKQTSWALPKPRMPIGMIPGGSTNTIPYCLNGTDDVRTAVLNIVLGKVDGMDLSSVHRNAPDMELLRLYSSAMSYGYLADVTKEAEKYRHMGPKRYEYVGVKKFLKNAAYEGEIKVLLKSGSESNNWPDGNRVDNECKCLEACSRCEKAKNNCDSDLDQLNQDLADPSRWKVIRGKYFMISGVNLSCACDRSPQGLSPFCHVGDGCLDLVLVKHGSTLSNLRLVNRLTATGKNISTLPFIEMYRTRAFTFSVPQATNILGQSTPSINTSTVPINRVDGGRRSGQEEEEVKKSCWNCDGEIIDETDLLIRTHCQLVRVYRSGIRQTKKDCIGCGLC